MHSGDRWENACQNAYLIIYGLTVTFTFDLLTVKSNQFIFVPNCTKVMNLVKFSQRDNMWYRVNKLLVYDREYADSQPENSMTYRTDPTVAEAHNCN